MRPSLSVSNKARHKQKGATEAAPLIKSLTFLLVTRLFLGQLNLGRFQLLRQLGDVVRIHFRGYGLVPLVESPLPVRSRQLQTAGLLIQIAKMVLNRRSEERRVGKEC